MLKVFNTSILTSKQRFSNALLYGVLSSILMLVVYVFVQRRLPFEIFYLYLGFGYLIGMVIQKTGHGVQPKFSILAAVLCFLIILIGDLLVYFPDILSYLQYFPEMITELFGIYLAMDYTSVFALACRIAAIVAAYYYARVV